MRFDRSVCAGAVYCACDVGIGFCGVCAVVANLVSVAFLGDDSDDFDGSGSVRTGIATFCAVCGNRAGDSLHEFESATYSADRCWWRGMELGDRGSG